MRAGTACFRLSVLFHPCQEGSRRQLSTLTLLLERRLSVGQREYMGPKLEACQLLLSFASAVEIASGVLRGFGSVCSCILSSTLAWKACCRSICSCSCFILAIKGTPGSFRLTLGPRKTSVGESGIRHLNLKRVSFCCPSPQQWRSHHEFPGVWLRLLVRTIFNASLEGLLQKYLFLLLCHPCQERNARQPSTYPPYWPI